MASKALPSPEVLRQLLRYEPDTGKLFWLPRPVEMFSDGNYGAVRSCNMWNAKHRDSEAFTADDGAGYRCGRILGSTHRAHRIIWALQTGAWPNREIDHVDGDPGNNKWNNLRAASRVENMRNSRSRVGSSSKYLGVSWSAKSGKWNASIKVGERNARLGSFVYEVDAANAYDKAAAHHFGEFARLNLHGEQQ